MALNSYSALQAAVAALLAKTNLTAYIPDFITSLESEVNGSIRVRQMICRAQAVINQEFERVPTNFAGVKTVHIMTTPAQPLEFVDSATILEFKTGSTATGRPKYFSVVGEEFQFYPAPDGDYTVELATYETIPALATYDTNWLLERYPNVYLYGAAKHSAPFLRDDERLPTWIAMFEKALQDIRYADQAETYGNRPHTRTRRFG